MSGGRNTGGMECGDDRVDTFKIIKSRVVQNALELSKKFGGAVLGGNGQLREKIGVFQ